MSLCLPGPPDKLEKNLAILTNLVALRIYTYYALHLEMVVLNFQWPLFKKQMVSMRIEWLLE